ncbi:DUF4097 family beta strand repeat protein [Actinomadura barringtoniae]|uniref:DUF4097 family beta strand repeat protein n=1 Tax=Actinomadura barringtoniae TaxID=1427535 RepID=A0A939PQ38_9ACTN|nr:DUF4097 family beta strand repeat-containing protein [Actinomadura barringtoniae]MBO2454094.1 DUF4097 family beta strand repeat protein [Actinomadura barringtoniae]
MPTFDTPEPISALIQFPLGDLRITAEDRADTVVEVAPTSASSEADVQAARQLRVEYAGGKLLVKGARERGIASWLSWLGGSASVDVSIWLPTGSRVEARAAAPMRTEGVLGECVFESSLGDSVIDRTGELRLSTTHGDIRVGAVDGQASLSTSNGSISVGQVSGDLRAMTASGSITVDRALGGVNAKTAYGSVRLGEVVRGKVQLASAYGELEVGVRLGTAAWLEVHTQYGKVRNHLTAADAPAATDETVEVHARNGYGDIVIRRA